ncbi:hypothetical protein D3C87_1695180 [compost metagenome]
MLSVRWVAATAMPFIACWVSSIIRVTLAAVAARSGLPDRFVTSDRSSGGALGRVTLAMPS